mmetsp:Transcript_12603/g.22995  ORF Transcript_12603/g.22995 Transcript_12603/m.22995 type:complete len:281 (+) Transcript_12603:378-1220(+)
MDSVECFCDPWICQRSGLQEEVQTVKFFEDIDLNVSILADLAFRHLLRLRFWHSMLVHGRRRHPNESSVWRSPSDLPEEPSDVLDFILVSLEVKTFLNIPLSRPSYNGIKFVRILDGSKELNLVCNIWLPEERDLGRADVNRGYVRVIRGINVAYQRVDFSEKVPQVVVLNPHVRVAYVGNVAVPQRIFCFFFLCSSPRIYRHAVLRPSPIPTPSICIQPARPGRPPSAQRKPPPLRISRRPKILGQRRAGRPKGAAGLDSQSDASRRRMSQRQIALALL